MDRIKSSAHRKPPLPLSPRRLRSRRGVSKPDVPSPVTPQRVSTPKAIPQESPGFQEYLAISQQLWKMAKRAKEEPMGLSPLFERGRHYDEYALRRNERLMRRRSCHDLGVTATDIAKKKVVTKRCESGRRSSLPVEMSYNLRSSVKSKAGPGLEESVRRPGLRIRK